MVSAALPGVYDLENPICDLTRKALAVSLVAEAIDRELRTWDRFFPKAHVIVNNRLKEELELLFAYIDDVKFQTKAIRENFYEVLNATIEADNQRMARAALSNWSRSSAG